MTNSKIEQIEPTAKTVESGAKLWQRPTLQSIPVLETQANTVHAGDALNSQDVS